MTASIPTPTITPDGALAALGGFGKIELNQSDIPDDGSFGELLGEALSGLPGESPPTAEMSAQAENLIGRIQSLPQGGKLLPLLTPVLNQAFAGDGDAKQLLLQLNTSLEQLSQNADASSLEAVTAVLYQLVDANPRYFGKGNLPQLPAKSMVEEVWQQLTGKGSTRPGLAVSEQVAPDTGLRTFEKILPQAAVHVSPPGQVQTDLMAALHAIRRLAGGRSAEPDALVKIETVAGTSATAGTTGTSTASTPANGPMSLTLGVPLQQANWDQALGERIQWLVSQGGQSGQGAQIKLNPAHLGPMEVRIQMRDDQANIQFTATHAVVREALEAALPRLREMLGASGVELVDVNISGESFAEQQRTDQEQGDAPWKGAGSDLAEGHETVIESPLISVGETGVLDLFA